MYSLGRHGAGVGLSGVIDNAGGTVSSISVVQTPKMVDCSNVRPCGFRNMRNIAKMAAVLLRGRGPGFEGV